MSTYPAALFRGKDVVSDQKDPGSIPTRNISLVDNYAMVYKRWGFISSVLVLSCGVFRESLWTQLITDQGRPTN